MSSSKGGSSRSSNNNSHVLPSAGRELLLELKRSTVSNNTAASGSGSGGGSSYLPPYNTKLTRACFADLKESVQNLKDIVQASAMTTTNTGGGVDNDDDHNHNESSSDNYKKPSMSTRPSMLFHQASIQRNKRCLLAYHKHRMDSLMKNSSQYYHNVVTTNTANNTTSTSGGDGGGGTTSPSNNNQDENRDQQGIVDNNNLHPLEIQFIKDYYELRQLYADTIEIDFLSNNMGVIPPPTSNSYQIQVRVLKTLGPIVLEYSGRSVNFTKGTNLFMSRNDAMEFLQMGILEYMDGEEVDF